MSLLYSIKPNKHDLLYNLFILWCKCYTIVYQMSIHLLPTQSIVSLLLA